MIVWGTRITLDNALVLARHYQVSDFFVGVVVLAIGSDLPELVVSVAAAIRQLSGEETANLIVGNALGSCFGQFGLVMGTAGLISPLSLPKRQVYIHGGMLLVSMLLLAIVAWDQQVSRLEGALLAGVFILYITLLVGVERAGGGEHSRTSGAVGRVWLLLIFGMTLVVASADVIVNQALMLAALWGVDQSYVGIAIVGIGTSLPELMISVGAALRSRIALSVGNLMGSNILDVLLPIGTAALLTPLHFDAALLGFDLPLLLALSLLVLGFLLTQRGIRRVQALVLLGCYLGYILVISPGI